MHSHNPRIILSNIYIESFIDTYDVDMVYFDFSRSQLIETNYQRYTFAE